MVKKLRYDVLELWNVIFRPSLYTNDTPLYAQNYTPKKDSVGSTAKYAVQLRRAAAKPRYDYNCKFLRIFVFPLTVAQPYSVIMQLKHAALLWKCYLPDDVAVLTDMLSTSSYFRLIL